MSPLTETRFRTLADNAPVMIWVSGLDTRCTWFNRRWLEFVGQTMSHELGDGWAEGVHPDDLRSCLSNYTSAFDARRPFSMEYRLRRHDGAWRWILDTGTPAYEPKGAFSGYIGSCVDITESRTLYSALQHAYDELRRTQQAIIDHERLRVLGQMASGIAHDITNAISPVSLYTDAILERDPGLSADTREYLRTIRCAVDDVSQTLARLRDFSRPREPHLKIVPVDLNALVEQVKVLTRVRWKDMPLLRGTVIDMHTDPTPEVATVLGVESELREALTNLVINAVDAMPSGGTVTLRTRVVASQAKDGLVGRTAVCLEVEDTGIGMTEDTRRRCLEPFFTTKGERGTGLGLAMVYGVVQRHNAHLDFESSVGKGTTVRISFAAQSGSLFDPTAAAESVTAPPPSLRILVIDDDPALTKSLRDVLQRDGHDVMTASGGSEGIEEFSRAVQRGDDFDVVVTDLAMPHVSGYEVAAAIKATSARAFVVLLTGWDQATMTDGVPANIDLVLGKPPRLQELRTALASSMSERAART